MNAGFESLGRPRFLRGGSRGLPSERGATPVSGDPTVTRVELDSSSSTTIEWSSSSSMAAGLSEEYAYDSTRVTFSSEDAETVEIGIVLLGVVVLMQFPASGSCGIRGEPRGISRGSSLSTTSRSPLDSSS